MPPGKMHLDDPCSLTASPYGSAPSPPPQAKVWGEGLRALLAPHGVCVTVVCPGFIETPLTDALEPRHWWLRRVRIPLAAAVDGQWRGGGVDAELAEAAQPSPRVPSLSSSRQSPLPSAIVSGVARGTGVVAFPLPSLVATALVSASLPFMGDAYAAAIRALQPPQQLPALAPPSAQAASGSAGGASTPTAAAGAVARGGGSRRPSLKSL